MPDRVIIFRGSVRILVGRLSEIWDEIQNERAYDPSDISAFDAETGRVFDLPVARPSPPATEPSPVDPQPRRRGRPKLGVIAREVTLLPRHWDWLASQRGGASATLRRLIDDARKIDAEANAVRQRQTAAYNFMTEMAGNLQGFEEALRCLYRNDRTGFLRQIRAWPSDIRQTAAEFAFGAQS